MWPAAGRRAGWWATTRWEVAKVLLMLLASAFVWRHELLAYFDKEFVRVSSASGAANSPRVPKAWAPSDPRSNAARRGEVPDLGARRQPIQGWDDGWDDEDFSSPSPRPS